MESLVSMGKNIREARLAKGFSLVLLADYAGISRNTLLKIEKGNPTVSIGSVYAVLVQLGLEKDIAWIAHQEFTGLDFLRKHAGKYYRSKLERDKS